ncbi:MAG: amidohydrolase [Acidobacteria bacterium]|nr:amidohydrolase [Acidobacteriota bacterium]
MRLAFRLLLLPVAGLLGCTPSTPQVSPATLLLRNGHIVTMDRDRPTAQALAVRNDRIVALGTNEALAVYAGPETTVIDLAGQTAVPGLIEGHGHFLALGQSRMVLDLMDMKSYDEIVAAVAAAAKTAAPGTWIQGRGWHQEKWSTPPVPAVEGFPVHDALSAVAPNHPVVLEHASGHALLANARAMALAGVTSTTKAPAGGDILMGRGGQPSGIFRETASGLIEQALERWQASRTPEERRADMQRQVTLAAQTAIEHGITSFQDAGSSFETVALFKQMARDGQLGVRLWVMVRDSNERLRARLPQERVIGMAEQRLTVAAIKVTADGALGSRGAWMLDPYSDAPGSTGLSTVPMAQIAETATIAAETETQLAVHAIGDRANRETLDVYAAAFRAHPERSDWRWRIEHAQHVSPADVPRFAQLGVIASMQGIHATSDAPYVLARLGPDRAASGAYIWKTFLDAGVIVSNGTDVPVERIDPIANFHATVTRRTRDGSVFYGNQRMTREQALRSYTWNAAYAAREEAIKGSLSVGKLADITVLSQDLLTVPDDALLNTRVVKTIIGGKVLYGS